MSTDYTIDNLTSDISQLLDGKTEQIAGIFRDVLLSIEMIIEKSQHLPDGLVDAVLDYKGKEFAEKIQTLLSAE